MAVASVYAAMDSSSSSALVAVFKTAKTQALALFNEEIVVLRLNQQQSLAAIAAAEMEQAFIQYTKNIKPGGTLIVKHGLHRAAELKADNIIHYSLQNDAADVYAANIVQKNGSYTFDIIAKDWHIKDLYLPIGGMHNVENAIAAITVAKLRGIEDQRIIEAFAKFKGVKRRFEYILKDEQHVFVDDYAHHPEELAALITSAKKLFPHKKCVVAFQPHLYLQTV